MIYLLVTQAHQLMLHAHAALSSLTCSLFNKCYRKLCLLCTANTILTKSKV